VFVLVEEVVATGQSEVTHAHPVEEETQETRLATPLPQFLGAGWELRGQVQPLVPVVGHGVSP